MKNVCSNRVLQIKPSPTFAMTAKANAMRADGKKIVDLAVGEPDFDTPDYIKIAAIEAINRGFTKYTAPGGIIGLKKAIVTKFWEENQLKYEPNQIIVSSGAKQSLYNLFQALLNPLDEVIIPAPYWVSYPDMVLLADAKPVTVFAGIEHHFKITAHQLEEAITRKTRLLILNSPSNPTGMVYSKKELKALGKILLEHPRIFIVTDDIYEKIYWGKEPFTNLLNHFPELADRVIVVNGMSKTYAMTGWRIGYAAGPETLIQAMTNIQSQSTSNPCSISQIAAQRALEGEQTSVQQMVAAFKERHDFVIKSLNEINGIECLPTEGAFYAFPKVTAIMKKLKIDNDIDFADYLLTKAEVATVPGSGFGAPGYCRLSFANSMENLETALENMKSVLR